LSKSPVNGGRIEKAVKQAPGLEIGGKGAANARALGSCRGLDSASLSDTLFMSLHVIVSVVALSKRVVDREAEGAATKPSKREGVDFHRQLWRRGFGYREAKKCST
jgi:hypothetical protein